MTTVCTSGYFNPIHIGHIALFKRARELGDYLVVIVNTDYQVSLKGSKPFMNEQERCDIVKAIRYVDEVVLSIDEDKTIRKTLEMIEPDIFAKGGDSTFDNIPELDVCKRLGIKVFCEVGGGKIQSSSWLLKKK